MAGARALLLTVVIGVLVSLLDIGFAWVGGRLDAPLVMSVALLVLWAAGAAAGVVATGRVRYGLLAVLIGVLTHSTLGNALLNAARGVSWNLDPFAPPFDLLRSLGMNAALGLMAGLFGAWIGTEWRQRRERRDGAVSAAGG